MRLSSDSPAGALPKLKLKGGGPSVSKSERKLKQAAAAAASDSAVANLKSEPEGAPPGAPQGQQQRQQKKKDPNSPAGSLLGAPKVKKENGAPHPGALPTGFPPAGAPSKKAPYAGAPHPKGAPQSKRTTRQSKGAPPDAPKEGEKSKRYRTLLEVKNPMEVEGEEEFMSDDDEEINRSGAVPLWWYDKYKHIGYDAEGNRIEKTLDESAIGQLLQKETDGDSWRYVKDIRNDRLVRLTDKDLQIMSRIKEGKYPDPRFNEADYIIDSDLEDSIFPMKGLPPKKAQFLPSSHEQKQINRYIKMLREGKTIRPLAAAASREETLQDIWEDRIFMASSKHKLQQTDKAPKLQLPGHAESYNPPEEYLFTPEEEAEWQAMPPESRPLPFVPKRFSALRRVPAYANLVLERYNRCLDLYLCPRSVKHRMNIDPSSLLPSLPSAESLKPFPQRLFVSYLPLSLYAQRVPRPQPLYAFLLPFIDPQNQKQQWPEATNSSSGSSHCSSSDGNGVEGKSLLGPEGAAVRTVTADAKGRFVAAGSSDGCLRVFETRSGRIVAALLLQQQITAAAFHPTLPILAVAAAEQLLLIVLDVPLFDEQTQQQLTAEAAAGAKKKRYASADNTAAASAAVEGEETEKQGIERRQLEEALDLLLVKTAAEEELPSLLQTAEAESIDSSSSSSSNNSNSAYVVEATVGSKLIGCWQQVSMRHAKAAAKAAKKEVQQLYEQQQQQQQQQEQLEEAHEPTLLLRGVKRAVFIMHDAPILRLKWQHKGNYLVAVCPGSSSPSHQLLIHNIKKQRSIKPLRKRGPGALRDAAFHPLNPWLVVAYTRGLRIYDLSAKQRTAGTPGTRQALVKKLLGVDTASAVDVHSSGGQLIVGGENGKLYFFDIELSSRAFKIFRSHSHAITTATFHPTLPLMATSSMDGTVQVYYCRVYDDLITNPLIVPVKTLNVCDDSTSGGGVSACIWHPKLPWLFTSDREGGCYLWR